MKSTKTKSSPLKDYLTRPASESVSARRKKQDEIINEMITVIRDEKKFFSTSLHRVEWDQTFENLDESHMSDSQKRVRKILEEWDRDSNFGFTLLGAPGLAKTRLMKSLLIKNCDKNRKGLFVKMNRLIEVIVKGDEVSDEILKRAVSCNYLIIDDVGYSSINKTAAWVIPKISEVIDTRIAHKLPTFFTSNLTAKKIIEEYGIRFYERMKESSVPIRIEGESYRSAISKKNLESSSCQK